MTPLSDQPAFPAREVFKRDGSVDWKQGGASGMTYRQWLAGLAMQGLLSNDTTHKTKDNGDPIENRIAWCAVRQADALIARLEGKQ